MNKTWNEMTEAEKNEINRQEDARESYKDAMSGWEPEDDMMFGDPKHCPAHPHITISSADQRFDGPCPACEYAISLLEEAEEEMISAPWLDWTAASGPPVPKLAPVYEDDLPF